jgi:hypothetical protein
VIDFKTTCGYSFSNIMRATAMLEISLFSTPTERQSLTGNMNAGLTCNYYGKVGIWNHADVIENNGRPAGKEQHWKWSRSWILTSKIIGINGVGNAQRCRYM